MLGYRCNNNRYDPIHERNGGGGDENDRLNDVTSCGDGGGKNDDGGDDDFPSRENGARCGDVNYFVSSSEINTPFTKYLYCGWLAKQVLKVTILLSLSRVISSLELKSSNLGFIMLY